MAPAKFSKTARQVFNTAIEKAWNITIAAGKKSVLGNDRKALGDEYCSLYKADGNSTPSKMKAMATVKHSLKLFTDPDHKMKRSIRSEKDYVAHHAKKCKYMKEYYVAHHEERYEYKKEFLNTTPIIKRSGM